MKKILLLILAAFLCVAFCSCMNLHVEKKTGTYDIIIIDSCEYIQNSRRAFNNYAFTHKGNCKFCKERNHDK